MRPFSRSAAVYDLIYESRVDYDWHAGDLARHVSERFPGADSLVEMACGTGQVLSRLSEVFDVTGCDISEEMIAVCRARNPSLDVRVGDYRHVAMGRQFDALLCVFSSIGYMDTFEELGVALRNFALHLVAGGVAVIDGWLRPELAIDGFRSVETHENSEMIVTRTTLARVQDGKTIMTMGHTVVSDSGLDYFEEVHSMGLFSDDAYRSALEAAGFVDVSVEDGFDGRGRFVAVRR